MALLGSWPACSGEEPAAVVDEVEQAAPPEPVPEVDDGGFQDAGAPEELACKPELNLNFHVEVAGVDTGIAFDAQALGDGKIQVYPLGGSSVLVAWKPNWLKFRSRHQDLDSAIWLVDCTSPEGAAPFVREAGSDFGNGTLSSDRRSIYYSGRDGVRRLDLASARSGRVLPAPMADSDCWYDHQLLRDVVVAPVKAGLALRILRGGPCGYRGSWIFREAYLYTPERPDRARVYVPRQVASVAADSGGLLWVGDGGRCHEPGIQDPQTHGAVWVSSDMGASWRYVPVIAGEAKMHAAARLILADAERPGHLVIHSQPCDWPSMSVGGVLYVTRDGGETWTSPVAAEVGAEVEDGFRVSDMTIVDGSIDRLVVWDAEGTPWESADGGESWTEGDVGSPPTGQGRSVVVGEFTFEATADGLVRKGDALVVPTRVFPLGGTKKSRKRADNDDDHSPPPTAGEYGGR